MYQSQLYDGLLLAALESFQAGKPVAVPGEETSEKKPHDLSFLRPLLVRIGDVLVATGMKLQEGHQLNHRLSTR